MRLLANAAASEIVLGDNEHGDIDGVFTPDAMHDERCPEATMRRTEGPRWRLSNSRG
jgi:hypothetical protein